MAYAAVAESSFPSVTVPPSILALQRALMWLVGASGSIVFIEPSPYEFTTLIGIVVFTAAGTRLRLAFVPLLLLMFLDNIGYMMGAVPYLGESVVTNWIITSWYMAITVMFVAMVVAEDTTARLDMLRRGLVAGGVIASLAGIAGYFHLIPGAHDVLTLYDP